MSIHWGVGMWVRARGWPRVGDSRVRLAACVQGVSGDQLSPEAGGGRGMEQDGGTVPQGHPSWEPKAQPCQAWGPLPPPPGSSQPHFSFSRVTLARSLSPRSLLYGIGFW